MGPAVDKMFHYLYRELPIPIIVGPTCSDVCKAMASTSYNWNVNIVSPIIHHFACLPVICLLPHNNTIFS